MKRKVMKAPCVVPTIEKIKYVRDREELRLMIRNKLHKTIISKIFLAGGRWLAVVQRYDDRRTKSPLIAVRSVSDLLKQA